MDKIWILSQINIIQNHLFHIIMIKYQLCKIVIVDLSNYYHHKAITMKFSIVLTTISLTAFGLLLLPVVSPLVRMAGITVAYIPSMASSGLSFYYFYLIPDSRYSLLTTSANSVVGYHMLMATGFYIHKRIGNDFLFYRN